MSIEYVTLPETSSMSVKTAFCGSAGSTSPNATPRSFWYAPTLPFTPNSVPPKVGFSMLVITIFVIRARAVPGTSATTSASALIERIAKPVFMGLPSGYTVRPAAAAQARGRSSRRDARRCAQWESSAPPWRNALNASRRDQRPCCVKATPKQRHRPGFVRRCWGQRQWLELDSTMVDALECRYEHGSSREEP